MVEIVRLIHSELVFGEKFKDSVVRILYDVDKGRHSRGRGQKATLIRQNVEGRISKLLHDRFRSDQEMLHVRLGQ